jgi:hypothetical protein
MQADSPTINKIITYLRKILTFSFVYFKFLYEWFYLRLIWLTNSGSNINEYG